MADKEKLDLSMFLGDYLNDARDGFQHVNTALLELEKDYSLRDRIDHIFRVFHSLKSSSAMLQFSSIADLAHAAEDLLDGLRKGELQLAPEMIGLLFAMADVLEGMVKDRGEGMAEEDCSAKWGGRIAELRKKSIEFRGGADIPADDVSAQSSSTAGKTLPPGMKIDKIKTLRVNVELLDNLFNLVGEIIITKNRLNNIVADSKSKELKDTIIGLERMVNELQENVAAARLVPADELLRKFPRMVHDIAKDEHKNVELVLAGRDTELDKNVLDTIGEPLIHLVRNALAHGIETPDERVKQGKPGPGILKLTVRRGDNYILIDVEDDGRGIDTDHLRQSFVSKGLSSPEELEALSEKGLIDLIFKPGFTTAEKVTGVSGRGVGLDVVITAVRSLGGTVEVTTSKGQGTRFRLQLPLTTAIMQTLMVEVAGHTFAIPTDNVLEIMAISPGDLRDIGDRQVLLHGNQVIPLFRLHDMLNIPFNEEKGRLIGVIIFKDREQIALGVDAVLGQLGNVVKPFDPLAQRFSGFSGGTILGDGRVALLLDINGLFSSEK